MEKGSHGRAPFDDKHFLFYQRTCCCWRISMCHVNSLADSIGAHSHTLQCLGIENSWVTTRRTMHVPWARDKSITFGQDTGTWSGTVVRCRSPLYAPRWEKTLCARHDSADDQSTASACAREISGIRASCSCASHGRWMQIRHDFTVYTVVH